MSKQTLIWRVDKHGKAGLWLYLILLNLLYYLLGFLFYIAKSHSKYSLARFFFFILNFLVPMQIHGTIRCFLFTNTIT